jgi:PAS domain S-box-containing protein
MASYGADRAKGAACDADRDTYRTLIAATGAAICETDADGAFTYVTDRYCELVGLPRDELIGKRRFQELASPQDPKKAAYLLATSVKTNKPFRLNSRYSRPDGSIVWINLDATWVGEAGGPAGRWIAVATDITECKKAQEATRVREANKSFLLRLGDRLRPLSCPAEVMAVAARALGEYLNVNRVVYSEISEDGTATSRADYVNGVASLTGRMSLNEYAPDVLDNLRQNVTTVVTDTWRQPNVTAKQREGYEAASVRAHVSVPIHGVHRLVGALGVHHAQPRLWTDTEISLIEETAQRTGVAIDQARTEEALRVSEAHSAAIFSHAAVGLCELTLDGHFKRVNDKLCELLGRSREELLQLGAQDVTHPEDVAHTSAILSEVLEKGGTVTLDKRYVRPDGETIFANSAVTRLDDDQGRPQVVLAVTVDLTERRRAEKALAEDLEDSLRLQDISTQLVPHGDVQQLFETITKAAAEITHADHGVMHLYDSDSRKLRLLATYNVNGRLRKACETEAADACSACAEAMRGEARVVVTDYETDERFAGSPAAQQYVDAGVRAVQSTPLISRAGRLVGMVATHWRRAHEPDARQLRLLDILGRQAADLIERSQADAALRASEERYRTLFNSIDEGFCVMEVLFADSGEPADYRYLTVNPAFERQTGVANVVGKTQRELVPTTEQRWFDIFGEIAVKGNARRFINEVRALGRWYDVYAFRVGGRESRQVAALFSDITHRVQVEEELKQADRRKTEFLAVLAHELRNPLAPIRAGLEILRMTPRKEDKDVRMLELIDRQTRQMIRLVDDLLDLSRISQGKVHIERKAAKLQDILDDAIEVSTPVLNASGAPLSVKMPQEPVWIDADAVRLSQVFSNLLNNAAKYTGTDGEIFLVAEVQERDLRVSVCDTGTGIRPDMLNKIFEAFTQADSTMSRSQGGLGIGLALVRTLVQLHGGTVAARSEGEGKGSEFVVSLPEIVTTAVESETFPKSAETKPLAPHRVLVVDDNADAADTLATMLRMSGEEVEVAHSGPEGLSLAEKLHPQLLLLDLGMPDVDGYEVACRIRSQPWGHSIVISALTGWGQEADRTRSKEAGFDYHLVKPVDLNALRSMLDSLPSH